MQKNSKKVLSACSVATLLIAGTTLPATVKADSSSNVTRIGGADRYETAAKVADAGWTSSSYAIVANGEGYADALCATPLAKAKNAPILLTYGNSLNQNVLDQLKNLKVEHVIVVGGTGVVPDSVVDEIKAQVSDVQRLGGQDRYETSVKIADALGTKPTKAVVASGEGYADALSAGPAAAINGIPILLTTQNTLPDAETNYLKANSNITATYVIGETGSVSDSVKDSLPSPTRLGGADRYETNIAVLKEFKSDFGFGNVYAALGNGPVGNEFADALTGGALAAKNKNPLIITGLSLSSATTDFLDENVPKNSTLTILGGTGNISDSFADEIKDAFGKASTGGGGGGSTTYKNITSDVAKYYGPKIKEVVNNNPNLSKYFNVNDVAKDGKIILTVTDEYKNRVVDYETLFDNSDNADLDTIKSRVETAYDLANEHSKSVTIDGKTFKDYLVQEKAKGDESKFSKYIEEDGTIDSQAIAEKIKSGTITYDDYQAFVSSLNSAVKGSIDLNQPSPEFTLKDTQWKVNRVDQDGVTLYNSNDSRADNVDSILSSDSPLGTYRIYTNTNEYFVVTVQK